MSSARSAHRRRGSLGGIDYDLSNRWYEDLSQELSFVQKEAQQSLEAAWTEAEQWRAQDVELSEMVAKLESRLRIYKEEAEQNQESSTSFASGETERHSNHLEDDDQHLPTNSKNSLMRNNGVLQEPNGRPTMEKAQSFYSPRNSLFGTNQVSQESNGRPALQKTNSCYGRLEADTLKKHNSSLNDTEATWCSSDDRASSPPPSRRSSASSVTNTCTANDSTAGEAYNRRNSFASSRRSSCGSDVSNSGGGAYSRRRSSCGSTISAIVDAGYPLPTMIEEDHKEAEELIEKAGRKEAALSTLRKTVELQERTMEELENDLVSQLEQALEKESAKLTERQRKMVEIEDERILLCKAAAKKKDELSQELYRQTQDLRKVHDSQTKQMEAELEDYRLYLEDEMDKLQDKLPNNNDTGPPENDLATKISNEIKGLGEAEDELAEILVTRLLEREDLKNSLNRSTTVFKKAKGTAAFVNELSRLLTSSGKAEQKDKIKHTKEDFPFKTSKGTESKSSEKKTNANNHKDGTVKFPSLTKPSASFQDSSSNLSAFSFTLDDSLTTSESKSSEKKTNANNHKDGTVKYPSLTIPSASFQDSSSNLSAFSFTLEDPLTTS